MFWQSHITIAVESAVNPLTNQYWNWA